MDSTSPPVVELAVPAGQVEIGCLLIKAIYQPRLDLSSCSSAQLGQLLQLADQYQVSHVIGAVSIALSDRAAAEDWEAVVAVYCLPESTQKLPECGAAVQAAQALLVEVLGDLEVDWDIKQEQKQKQLLGLPFQWLQQLLQHQNTKVASEDTVVFTIDAWLKYNNRTATKQEQRDLAQTIRVAHCSPLFVGTVMPGCPWLVQAWGVEDLMAASVLACKPNQQAVDCIWSMDELRRRHPAWAKPRRPASSLTTMELSWAVPVSKLKEMAAASNMIGVQTLRSGLDGVHTAWSGVSFTLVLQVCREAGMKLSLQLRFPGDQKEGKYACNIATYRLGVINTIGRLSTTTVGALATIEEGWVETGSSVLGRGKSEYCVIRAWATPEELEQRLCAASLLHPDRSLHLQACVKSIG
jgi:hypothetical protein